MTVIYILWWKKGEHMFDKEYVFYGKHAKMADKLKAKLDDEIGRGFFSTIYEIYQVAPIVGLIYSRKGKRDKGSETTKVFADKMMNEKENLLFNYRNVMLKLYHDNSQVDAMKIAFRLDHKDEEREEYDKLYDAYVLGGLEEIYERIFEQENPSTVEDYIMNLYEFIEDLNVRLYGFKGGLE